MRILLMVMAVVMMFSLCACDAAEETAAAEANGEVLVEEVSAISVAEIQNEAVEEAYEATAEPVEEPQEEAPEELAQEQTEKPEKEDTGSKDKAQEYLEKEAERLEAFMGENPMEYKNYDGETGILDFDSTSVLVNGVELSLGMTYTELTNAGWQPSAFDDPSDEIEAGFSVKHSFHNEANQIVDVWMAVDGEENGTLGESYIHQIDLTNPQHPSAKNDYPSYNLAGITENSTIDQLLAVFGKPESLSLATADGNYTSLWYSDKSGARIWFEVDSKRNGIVDLHILY